MLRGFTGAAIVILTLVGSAFAQPPSALAAFTAICDEELSTGFNWEEGRWVAVNFKKVRYLARKITSFSPGKQTDGSFVFCTGAGRDDNYSGDNFAVIPGCYSFEEQGAKPNFGWCDEFYGKENGSWVLALIECPGGLQQAVKFQPNGNFSRASSLGSIEPLPTDDYKDSFAISVGKCSVIS